MVSLRTLGAIGLVADDGQELGGLLSQPKRLGLLAYLASPEPGTWHRRDTLVGVFWPDLDAGKARTALRNALYVLRQQLGPDVVRTRGDDEVSVDPGQLQSDGSALRRFVTAGRTAEAVALYQGEFLPGLFIREAPEFERWLDEERRRLKALAAAAAAALCADREAAGDFSGAAAAQQRLTELDPADEAAARRLMTLLDRGGNRGRALEAYERLRAQLWSEFEAEPSAATQQLAAELRSRQAPVPAGPGPAGDGGQPPAEVPQDRPTLPSPPRQRLKWLIAGATAAILVVTALLPVRARPAAEAGTTTLLVLPMRNATGDPANDPLVAGLTEELVRRLSAFRSFQVRVTSRADWPQASGDSLAIAGKVFGASLGLRSRLEREGDSLRITAQVVDLATGEDRNAQATAFTMASVADAESRLAAAVYGAAFRVPVPEVPRPASTRISPEAFNLTVRGWHSLLTKADEEAARDLFTRATEVDPTYARAWSGLSSSWAVLVASGQVPFEDGVERAEFAAKRAIQLDSLEGSAWANLGILHALRDRSVAAGEPYLQRAVQAEPSNPEVWLVWAAVLRHAHAWDRALDMVRVARRLDPLSPSYVGSEANLAMCADRPAEALALYQAQVALAPRLRTGHVGVARALARLGRWDDAIATLRNLMVARGDSVLVNRLAAAHGKEGYWAFKHAEGEAILAERRALQRKGWVSPYTIGVAEIGAGHIEAGMAKLEAEVRAGSRQVYKLPCNPEIDEVRSTPRFQRLLEAAGAMPLGQPGS